MKYKKLIATATLVGSMFTTTAAETVEQKLARFEAQLTALQAQVTQAQETQLSPAVAKAIQDQVAAASTSKVSIAKHIEKFKFKGDLRLRHETRERNANGSDRQRFRQRFRLGFTFETSEDWEVGFGLSTPNNSRSRNDTYQANFGNSNLVVDYAYIKHDVNDQLSFIGGQTKKTHIGSKLLWDSDIRPIGATAQFKEGNFFGSASVYNTSNGEISDKVSYGTMGLVQVGYKMDKANFALGFQHYSAPSLEVLNNVSGGTVTPGANFDVIDLYGDIKFKVGDVKMKAYAHAAYNVTAGDTASKSGVAGQKAEDHAGAIVVGLKTKLGKWALGYDYAYIQADVLPESIKDADFGRAAGQSIDTDIHGHIAKLSYSISKNSTVSVKQMLTQRIEGSRDGNLTQLDFKYKF